MQTQIISKQSWENTITSETTITIGEKSVVLVDIAPEDVEELLVDGDKVTIKLKNGETITIENFNYEESDLVFRTQDSELYKLDFANVEYNPIESIESLLAGGATGGPLILNNWLAGGALALGAAGIGVAIFDEATSSSSDNNPPQPQPLDKKPLEDAIDRAKDVLDQLDGYEKEWLEDMIEEAENLLNNPDLTQDLIDRAVDLLDKSIDEALKSQETKEAIADLEAAVEEAQAKLDNEDPNNPYTSDSKQSLEQAIEDAQKIIDDFNERDPNKPAPSLEDIANAKEELADAVDNLKTEWEASEASEEDLAALAAKASALQEKLDANDALENEADRYTTESRNALQAEIDAAKQLILDAADPSKTVTKGQVQDASDALDAADAALITNGQQQEQTELAEALEALEAKVEELQKKLDDNAALEDEGQRYTSESSQALQDAIDAAKDLIELAAQPGNTVNKDQVQDASDALDAADAALITNGEQQEQTELAEALEALEAKVEELQKKLDDNAALEDEGQRYTSESSQALQDAIDAAKDLIELAAQPGNTVNKDQVQDASDALDAADAALITNGEQQEQTELAEALEALEAKVEELQKKLDDNAALEDESQRYTSESSQALQDAIDAAKDLIELAAQPGNSVNKEQVQAADKALDDADAGLKTNAEQELEDTLADAEDLAALAAKASALQEKLDANDALENEADRYTTESRDALQAEIDAAKQLILDAADPSKTVTKGQVQDASDALDAADAALITNGEQQEQTELAEALEALEAKVEELQKKLDDNAALEDESQRYTSESSQALQDAIDAAKDLIEQAAQPGNSVNKEQVQAADKALDDADAGLKTNAEQELEDTLADAEDLAALAAKASALQEKLDANDALENEADRYTTESRNALQAEIDAAKQLILDAADPSKTVTKGQVQDASDALDAADAALKTNGQQQEEDEAEQLADAIAALEEKADQLQKKLDDNAALENEADRYTDASRTALQSEIDNALQLVNQYKEDARSIDITQVETADAKLDAADSALITNGQQQEEDEARELENIIAGLEDAIEAAEAKLAAEDQADPYTDASKAALVKEIEEAKELVAKYNTDKTSVKLDEATKAKSELEQATEALVKTSTENQEILHPADNDVIFVPETINPTQRDPNPEQVLSDKTGFAIASVGLGPVLSADLLTDVLKNSLEIEVGEGTVRQVTLKSQSGGLSIVSMYDLKVYQKDAVTGEYKAYLTEKQWLKAYLLGGVSDELTLNLPEGDYLVFLTPSVGITALTGYTLKVLSDIVLDYNEVIGVDGEQSGNVLTDNDAQHGQDVLPEGTILSAVTVNGETTPIVAEGETAIVGQFGTLYISQNGEYRYEIDESFTGPFGQVDSFSYTVTTAAGQNATANLNIQISNKIPASIPVELTDTVVLNPQPEITVMPENSIPKLTNVKVLDVSLLDPVLKAGAVDLSDFMNFGVDENQVRELTFQGDGGGVSLTSYSLFIYRLNESGELVKVHEIKNWYTVILGGRSGEVTLKFAEGDYYATVVPTGLNVFGGAGLTVNKDIIYDYSTVAQGTEAVGTSQGDVTELETDSIILVNNKKIESATLELDGQYGKLSIAADGQYQYVVNASQLGDQLPYGEIDTFTYVVRHADGTTSLKTLNIKLDLAKVQDDLVELPIQHQNKTEVITDETTLDVGLGQRTMNGEFEIKPGVVSDVVFTFNSTLSLNGSRSVNYVITDEKGNEYKGTLDGDTGNTLTLEGLEAGSYTITATLVNPGAAYFSDSKIVYNNLYLNEYVPVAEALAPITGTVTGNDEGISSVSSYTINGLTTSPFHGSPSIIIDGEYGQLTFKNDGSYSYTPYGDRFGVEEFVYTVETVGGTTSSATLSFNVTQVLPVEEQVVLTSAETELFDVLAAADVLAQEDFNSIEVQSAENTFDAEQTDILSLLSAADNQSELFSVTDEQGKTVALLGEDVAQNTTDTADLYAATMPAQDLTLEQLLQNGQSLY